MKIHVIILAGGSGKRLWPISTPSHPKQFCKILSSKTLLEETAFRMKKVGNVTILGSKEILKLAKQTLKTNVDYLEEDKMQNTAHAIWFAAKHFPKDSYLLFVPADHYFKDPKPLYQGIKKALPFVKLGKIVTFGIKPTGPETRFGYIEGNINQTIKQFHEKPTLKKAKNLLLKKRIYWNAGIFFAKSETILSEWKKFSHHKNESFDVAIMEKTKKGVVLPLQMLWDDLGSWKALIKYLRNKSLSNIKSIDTENCLIYSEELPIKAIGLRDLIIIASKNGILISKKDRTDQVKDL